MSVIKAGTVLSFSGGEWSDKWTSGPFNVLRDFDQKEVANSYLDSFVPACEWDEPDEHRFTDFLLKEGYIADVPQSFNWYIGAYGEFCPSIADEARVA